MSPSLLLQQPFIQITLPILIGFVAVGVWQNKRIDDLRAYLREFRAEMNSRLDRIDDTLKTYGQKIAVLEDRSSPLARR
jgi:hypothetical protein